MKVKVTVTVEMEQKSLSIQFRERSLGTNTAKGASDAVFRHVFVRGDSPILVFRCKSEVEQERWLEVLAPPMHDGG